MMVYKGKSIYIWMIWGYPYFRKPPYMCIPKYVIYIYIYTTAKFTNNHGRCPTSGTTIAGKKSGVVHTKLNHLAASSNTDTL